MLVPDELTATKQPFCPAMSFPALLFSSVGILGRGIEPRHHQPGKPGLEALKVMASSLFPELCLSEPGPF